MIIGRTGINGLVAYTPWFPRQGDEVTFVCDTIDATGDGTLDIAIEHKNEDDTDAGTANPGSFTQITAAGVTSASVSGLKELVRLKFTVGGLAASDWVHWRMLNPVWEHN